MTPKRMTDSNRPCALVYQTSRIKHLSGQTQCSTLTHTRRDQDYDVKIDDGQGTASGPDYFVAAVRKRHVISILIRIWLPVKR